MTMLVDKTMLGEHLIGGPPRGQLNLQPQISWKQSRILLSHSDKSLDLVMRSEKKKSKLLLSLFCP